MKTTGARYIYLTDLIRGYEASIRGGLAYLGYDKSLKQGARVAIKPNLTFPEYKPGVMTNPVAVESLIKVLKDYTNEITICEADSGGYNRFSMDEVFRKTGLFEIAKRYGVRIANLSKEHSELITVKKGTKELRVPLTRLLLHETDVFITMPVPKIHMNTGVSMSVKNQWGTIQLPSERLKLHPYFKEVIFEVNRMLPKAISIIDGRYGLNRSGPMRGDVVELNWLLVSDDLYAADLVCSTLMNIDPFRIPYLAYGFQKLGINNINQFQFNTPFEPFRSSTEFYLKRAWTDYPGLFTFRSRALAYIGYESPLAGLLHRLLYLFREPFYDYHRTKDVE